MASDTAILLAASLALATGCVSARYRVPGILATLPAPEEELTRMEVLDRLAIHVRKPLHIRMLEDMRAQGPRPIPLHVLGRIRADAMAGQHPVWPSVAPSGLVDRIGPGWTYQSVAYEAIACADGVILIFDPKGTYRGYWARCSRPRIPARRSRDRHEQIQLPER